MDPGSRGGEPPGKVSEEQITFRDAKECPSDLDMGALEREAMLSHVSKSGVVAVTSRSAASQNTRAQWSCLGFISGLARAASAVIVDRYWFKRVSGATTGVVEATDPISTFMANAGAGGAVADMMLVWRAAMSSEWSQQKRPSAAVQSSTRKREIGKS